jgi:nucleotide-binding universal stress UspA family protein
MIPTVIIVGADKGGVGKTMVARALLDCLASRGLSARVFDGQSPQGDLVRFAQGMIVDIGSVQDQMKMFDDVADHALTVVDLPAGLLSPTIRALDDAKLLDDVRSGVVKMVLLHVLGPTVSSIAEIAATAKKIDGVKHLLVKNHISGDAHYFDWDTGDTKAILDDYRPSMIDLPHLDDRAAEQMQKRGGTFLSYAADADSRVLRGRVHSWLEKVWREFDRVNVLGSDAR